MCDNLQGEKGQEGMPGDAGPPGPMVSHTADLKLN